MYIYLPLRQLIGDGILLANSITLQLTHPSKLPRRKVPEVTGPEPTQDIHNLRLEHYTGLGVDEVEGGGGPPAADPEQGALEGGGPGGGEDGEDVVLGGEGLDAVVLGVVGHGLLDQVVEGVVVVLRGGGFWGLGELVHQEAEVVEPGFVEAVEAHGLDSHGERERESYVGFFFYIER